MPARTASALACGAIIAGGLALLWPAALNGYPLVFVDTFTYLHHTLVPDIAWDKAPIYGPFIHLLHQRQTLWTPILAQGLAASWLIWLTQRALWGQAGAGAHLLLCLGLAALTTAPWYIGTLMPDAFTALVPLCLFLLAFGRLARGETLAVMLCATLAIGVHASHIALGLALLPLTLLLTRRLAPTLRVAAPVVLAVLVVSAANLVNFGRFSPSPHGAVCLLARLQADGPAVALMRDRCGTPEAAAWHLCRFIDRLPLDSDDFLWHAALMTREADGSERPDGYVRAVPESRAIVAATLATYPAEVARAMLDNTLRQMTLFRMGDTIGWLGLERIRDIIRTRFPTGEFLDYEAGLQARGRLPDAAEPFFAPHLPVTLLALAATALLLLRAARARDPRRAALLLFALAAIAANAFTSGALSKPHHRYQARIIWLLPLAAVLAWPRQREGGMDMPSRSGTGQTSRMVRSGT